MLLQDIFQDLLAPRELAPHDSVLFVGLSERSTAVGDGSPQDTCIVLELELFEPTTVDVAKEKSNHDVVANSIDKHLHNRP